MKAGTSGLWRGWRSYPFMTEGAGQDTTKGRSLHYRSREKQKQDLCLPPCHRDWRRWSRGSARRCCVQEEVQEEETVADECSSSPSTSHGSAFPPSSILHAHPLGPRPNRFARWCDPSPSRVHGRVQPIDHPKRQGSRPSQRHPCPARVRARGPVSGCWKCGAVRCEATVSVVLGVRTMESEERCFCEAAVWCTRTGISGR